MIAAACGAIVLALSMVMPFPSSAADPGADDPTGILEAYVNREDGSYAWSVRGEGEVAGSPYVELRLTSQTWRGLPWRHELFVVWPREMDDEVEHAVLFVHGGRWTPEMEDPGHRGTIPEGRLFALAAEELGAPVAIVRQVPHQPLFDGLTEDRLVAYTFDRYMEEGDPDWPILLPMVKSVVRAMDAVTEAAEELRGVRVEHFTVAGGSKRGWTTWLTGAVDDRVRGLVPISIDVLNMEAHLDHQHRAWGTFSEQIGDYIGRGLHERMETDAGRDLLATVDPYSYRDRLTQAKLVVVGTNDAYWPLDALNLYWDELPGPKWVLYLPNEGHGAGDAARVVGGIVSLARHAGEGSHLPEPSWSFEESPDALRLRVDPGEGPVPLTVRAWSAYSDGRDFRAAEWIEESCTSDRSEYRCELPLPAKGYGAMFAELTYRGSGLVLLHLSTQLRVAERKPTP